MNSKVMIIVAVISAAVVVTAGAVVILGNNGAKDDNSVIASQLQIYGNANDDYTINNDDLNIVKDIVDGKKNKADYPLADANGDGDVTSADIDVLQKIVNREEGCTVYVVSLDVEGKNVPVPVTYPLKNIVYLGANILMPIVFSNGSDRVAGYFASSYANWERDIISHATDLKGSSRDINDTSWKNFTELDSSLESQGGIGALIQDFSVKKGGCTEKYNSQLKTAGIPFLLFASADAESDIVTTLTLSFLFGKDKEASGVNYAKSSWKVLNEVKDKVGSLEDKDRASYIALNMTIYVCQDKSTYNNTPATAGGITYHKINSEFAAKYTGTGSTVMTEHDTLAPYKDCNYLLNIRSIDILDDTSAEKFNEMGKAAWDGASSKGVQYIEFFKNLVQYENGLVYVNNLLPGAVKVAYMAHVMYGDQFSESWAKGVLQTFIDGGYGTLKDCDIAKIPTIIRYSDFQKASA